MYSVSFNEISQAYEKDRKVLTKNREFVEDFISEQYRNEKIFILQNEDMKESVNVFNFYRKLKNFDIKKFISINKKQFFSPSDIDFFNYFSKAILYSTKRNYRFFRRIRFWIRELDSAGQGGFGKVFTAKPKGARDRDKIFLLKFSERKDEEVLFHEYFIGTIFANRLRKIIPNFSMIFGYIKCSMPASKFGFGREYEIRPCVVYEYIHPAETMFDFIQKKDRTTEDFFCIFMQICFSLLIANQKYGFVHNDLHSGNIMVKKFKDYIFIPYIYKGKKIYVKTKYLAVYIDYGLARVEIKKKEFGPYGIPARAMFEFTKSYPIKDIFTLLLDLIYIMRRTGFEGLNVVKEIVEFFTSASFKEIDHIAKKYYFYYPFNKDLEGEKGLIKFIDWIQENFFKELSDILFMDEVDPNEGMIIECESNECLTINEIYETIYRKKPIDDIFYYYDLYQYNSNVKPPENVLNENYENLKEQIKMVNNFLEDYKRLDKNLKYTGFIEIYTRAQDTIELYKVLKIFLFIDTETVKRLREIKVKVNKLVKYYFRKKVSLMKKDALEGKEFTVPNYLI